MPVVDRYGHLGGVARLVGDNDSLPAVRRGEDKAAAFIKRDRRAVYGDGIHILFVNGDCLRLAVGLAVLNAGDHRLNIVKRYAVGTEVCYVPVSYTHLDVYKRQVYEAAVPADALTAEDEDILSYDDIDDPDAFV